MAIPFDILDLIFGFLITQPSSLAACSEAHPIFSLIAEKYQYRQLVIDPESTCDLTKLLSDKPRLANYVRDLIIDWQPHISITKPFFKRVAVILPLFPLLESIELSYGDMTAWESELPLVFQKAMEACLHLPTLREVHIDCYDGFPVSLLDNHPNIDCFSLRGPPKVSDVADTIYPQLKSLSISRFYNNQHHITFGAWAKPRIARLQSLEYPLASDDTLLELLAICSDTLTSLDLTIDNEIDTHYATRHYFNSPVIRHNPPLSINLPPHLQNLTIRTFIGFYRLNNDQRPYDHYESFLPVAIGILKTAPSMHRITLEIDVDLTNCDVACFDDVDLSPLSALADTPRSFRLIDLHFTSYWDVSTKVVSLLANVGGIAELIEQDVLVVYVKGTKIPRVCSV